jgi:hypothetical protein
MVCMAKQCHRQGFELSNVTGKVLSRGKNIGWKGQQKFPYRLGCTYLYPAILAMELRESNVWARLIVRGMQSIPEKPPAMSKIKALATAKQQNHSMLQPQTLRSQ